MKSAPIISFTKDENEDGKKLLEKMGIKNNKYVCLMVRDAKYLKVRFPNEFWNYHDHRNYDIDDFDTMVKLITDRGYYVVRMGRDMDKKINITNKKVIDYSNSNFVTDFADVYLFANCDLCISTSTGAELIPRIFKKTIGQISPSIGFMYTNSNIINGMLNLYCKNTNKILNIEEIGKRNIFYVDDSQVYKNENINIIKDDQINKWKPEGMGYQAIQGSRPQTLAYALSDSPSGLAAWISEKFYEWTDCNGKPENSISFDKMLSNICLYWFSGAIGSSFWPYYARNRRPWFVPNSKTINIPVGYCEFPKEMLKPKKSLAEKTYIDIRRWSKMEQGGHFAAFENPEVLAKEMFLFFSALKL